MATTNVLPNGTNKFIALLTTLPTARDGTGLVEASGSGYARKAHQAWTNSTVANNTVRANNGAITFAALTGDLPGIVGWAIYDLIAGTNLIAFGPLVDAAGAEITRNFLNGDQPVFGDAELEVVIGAD
jgi:hypothetical protein